MKDWGEWSMWALSVPDWMRPRTMRHGLGRCQLLAAAVVLCAGLSTAQCCAACATVLTPKQAYGDSDAVAVGKVQQIQDQFVTENVQFQLKDMYKGSVDSFGPTIVLSNGMGSEEKNPDAINFKVGQTYLLYLHRIGNAWVTTTCDGSRLLTASGLTPAEQQALGPGKPAPDIGGTTIKGKSTSFVSGLVVAGVLYLLYRFTKKRQPKQRTGDDSEK